MKQMQRLENMGSLSLQCTSLRLVITLGVFLNLASLGHSLEQLQRFLEQPEASQEVHEGVTISLACRVENKLGILQWTTPRCRC